MGINDAHISFVQRKDLDVAKWDRCIDTATNGLIYAYSVYLDHMAPRWDALVMGDYEAVMPLTWNRKYGISYLYQPDLCAQLGVFGKATDRHLLSRFLLAVPSRFRYWDIYLNHGNLFPVEGIPVYERRNYVLALNGSYEQVRALYRSNISRNIKKSEQMGCVPCRDIPVSDVLEIAATQLSEREASPTQMFERFGKLYPILHAKGQAETFGIRSSSGQLISSCVFTRSHQRLYYIVVGNHPDGRTIGASHALIDSVIRAYAGSALLLDFEGSDVRNLAFFYSSFGAFEEKYAGVRQNILPFYLRWLKK